MFRSIAVLISLLLLANCAEAPPGEYVLYYQAETRKPYDDVLDELKSAIAENNFRITAHSRVGKVIRERGDKDFPEFDTIQFCNLTHARTMLRISPETIKYMPCNVVLYQKQGKTIVRTHLLPTDTDNAELNRFSMTMNEKLKEIVDFAVAE
ncbi:MAG: DUF302 domain-containing protein [Gammaproteobacteria bacterium]